MLVLVVPGVLGGRGVALLLLLRWLPARVITAGKHELRGGGLTEWLAKKIGGYRRHMSLVRLCVCLCPVEVWWEVGG